MVAIAFQGVRSERGLDVVEADPEEGLE